MEVTSQALQFLELNIYDSLFHLSWRNSLLFILFYFLI